jgi:phage-related minor tail protein
VQEVELMLKARNFKAKLMSQEVLVDKDTSTLAIITERTEQMRKYMVDYDKQLKSKKKLIHYQSSVAGKKSDQDEVAHILEVIKSSLSHLKGKHDSLKAKILMEAVASGKLFNGKAAMALSLKIRAHIKNLF